jgi:protein subunit release factor B
MGQKKLWGPGEVEVTHLKGSGPGGQNKNKRMTGVRLVHGPTGIVVMSTERRSQAQNLSNAYERLEERLRKHFHKPKKRFATKKTRSSQERRVEEKKRMSSHKRMRQRPSFDE